MILPARSFPELLLPCWLSDELPLPLDSESSDPAYTGHRSGTDTSSKMDVNAVTTAYARFVIHIQV
jgi:hypothetical protein